MASIRERGPYQFEVQIRRRGSPTVTKTFSYRRDAEAWARKTESEVERGLYIHNAAAERLTLDKALEQYSREITPSKKGSVQETYRINAWRATKLARMTMASLKGADVAAWRDERLKEGIAPATVRNDLALLSHVFTIAAQEWGLPVTNPVANIRKPRGNNARDRLLSNTEEKFLLDAIDNPEDSAGNRNIYMPAIVRLAIETAMRQGEILSLDWEHIDLEQRILHLPETKNGNPRDVPLSSRAVKALEDLGQKKCGPVFKTTASAVKQSWARALSRAVKSYKESCKKDATEVTEEFLEDLTFHDLRHLATTRLAEKFAMHELAKITGHKDTRMLLRYYHPKAEDFAKRLD